MKSCGNAPVVRRMESYVLARRGYEDLEVMVEKRLEKMPQNDKDRPNVILQDVDGNTEINVENGNNSDIHGIESISEVGRSAWDVPAIWRYVDISENLWEKKPWEMGTHLSIEIWNKINLFSSSTVN